MTVDGIVLRCVCTVLCFLAVAGSIAWWRETYEYFGDKDARKFRGTVAGLVALGAVVAVAWIWGA